MVDSETGSVWQQSVSRNTTVLDLRLRLAAFMGRTIERLMLGIDGRALSDFVTA